MPCRNLAVICRTAGYLLIRPADRDALFANHRCRFLVLDEVHTYRGVLGSNIALLLRRLRAHLARARQDWSANVPDNQHAVRYPSLLTVAIYVDGAAFHMGARLRRDRIIRNRLRQGPRHWTVVELRAPDLARGQALVNDLTSR